MVAYPGSNLASRALRLELEMLLPWQRAARDCLGTFQLGRERFCPARDALMKMTGWLVEVMRGYDHALKDMSKVRENRAEHENLRRSEKD